MILKLDINIFKIKISMKISQKKLIWLNYQFLIYLRESSDKTPENKQFSEL